MTLKKVIYSFGKNAHTKWVVFTIKNDFDSTLSINKLLTKIHWFEVYIIKPSDHHKQQNNNRKIQQHHTVVIALTSIVLFASE